LATRDDWLPIHVELLWHLIVEALIGFDLSCKLLLASLLLRWCPRYLLFLRNEALFEFFDRFLVFDLLALDLWNLVLHLLVLRDVLLSYNTELLLFSWSSRDLWSALKLRWQVAVTLIKHGV
jgi:hypothetical protein